MELKVKEKITGKLYKPAIGPIVVEPGVYKIESQNATHYLLSHHSWGHYVEVDKNVRGIEKV